MGYSPRDGKQSDMSATKSQVAACSPQNWLHRTPISTALGKPISQFEIVVDWWPKKKKKKGLNSHSSFIHTFATCLWIFSQEAKSIFPLLVSKLALWFNVADRKGRSGHFWAQTTKALGISTFSLLQHCPIPWEQSYAGLPDNELPQSTKGFPDILTGKESAHNAGDPSSIPGLGRSPGEGNLQYSGLENSMDCIHGAAKSQTWLSDFQFTSAHFHQPKATYPQTFYFWQLRSFYWVTHTSSAKIKSAKLTYKLRNNKEVLIALMLPLGVVYYSAIEKDHRGWPFECLMCQRSLQKLIPRRQSCLNKTQDIYHYHWD